MKREWHKYFFSLVVKQAMIEVKAILRLNAIRVPRNSNVPIVFPFGERKSLNALVARRIARHSDAIKGRVEAAWDNAPSLN